MMMVKESSALYSDLRSKAAMDIHVDLMMSSIGSNVGFYPYRSMKPIILNPLVRIKSLSTAHALTGGTFLHSIDGIKAAQSAKLLFFT